MHEHALARDLLHDLMSELPEGLQERCIRSVRIGVREGMGIEPGLLRIDLEEEAHATAFSGARFSVEEVPRRVACADCGWIASAREWNGTCPHCGGRESEPAGEEIELIALELDES